MTERKKIQSIKLLISVILTMSFAAFSASCSIFDEDGSGRIMNSNPSKPETQSTVITNATTETSGTAPVETSETTGTTETTETTESSQTSESSVISETTVESRLTFDDVRGAFVYSVWYDAVDSNPADYDEIYSDDAFALKGVFYFNKPLTTVFEAVLYRDDEVVMSREVKLKDNVTAEADFSAGLAGMGTFAPGAYYVELLYEGSKIAVTPYMRVI